MRERELLIRRKSNGSLKALVRMKCATTVTVYLLARQLVTIFSQAEYYFDLTDFADLYPQLAGRGATLQM